MTVMYLINHPSAQNLLNEFCVVPNHRRVGIYFLKTSHRLPVQTHWFLMRSFRKLSLTYSDCPFDFLYRLFSKHEALIYVPSYGV